MLSVIRRLVILLGLVSGGVHAAEPINTLKPGLFRDTPTEVAILGYDSVAYFTEGKPVAGDDRYTFAWQGATWKFASAAHRDRFAASPETYAPQYGGYCAYGVTRDYLVKIDPEAWDIVDGKLYLNYDKGVQKQWRADRSRLITIADQKFPGLLAE